jgi:hypothetical protein
MNLYTNYSALRTALSTLKLCGATQTDFLYLVELHFGYTSRGPLKSGRGYYLRNGTSTKDAVLAAAGDEAGAAPGGFMTTVLLPPLDRGRSSSSEGAQEGDWVPEVMRSRGGGPEGGQAQGLACRFWVEVGVEGLRREEFEWRMEARGEGEKGPRFTLVRLGGGQAVAELVFTSAWSMKHIARLELVGAGLTGELGERWALMVVTTALGLYWLRQHGKTRK